VVRLDSEMLDLDAKLFGFLAEQRFEPIRYRSNKDLTSSAR
jgi:hypothetical protein